jgi:hypothetical protein
VLEPLRAFGGKVEDTLNLFPRDVEIFQTSSIDEVFRFSKIADREPAYRETPRHR